MDGVENYHPIVMIIEMKMLLQTKGDLIYLKLWPYIRCIKERVKVKVLAYSLVLAAAAIHTTLQPHITSR